MRWWDFMRDPKHSNAIIAIFTSLIFVTGVLYTTFAGLQWSATTSAMKLDERAWVGVIKVNQFDFKTGPGFTIPFDVTNSGKTPALNVHSEVTLKSLEKTVVFVPTYDEPHPIKPSIYVIQPQMHMTLSTLPIDVSERQFNDIANGRGILYAYGHIVYDDIFGTEHNTTFCVMYWNGLPGPIACETYNNAN